MTLGDCPFRSTQDIVFIRPLPRWRPLHLFLF